MDAIDPRLHLGQVGPVLARTPREVATRTEEKPPAAPTESFLPGEVDEAGAIGRAGPPRRTASGGPAPFEFGSDAESLRNMRLMAEELRQTRKDLKAERKDLRQENGSIADKARVHGGLQDVGSALERIELAHRDSRWEQVASAVEGEVSPVYRSYFLHGRTPINEMKEVLRTAQDLADPESGLRLKGNDIQPLVRDEIWKTKMERLEEVARQPVRDGQPVEIDAEYYELASPDFVEKLARASRGGADVKVLMDPGTVSRMSGTPDATSLASRLNTVRRLEEGSGGRAGVQFFANREVLGGRDEIMHRKLLRVGDGVVFGGMNANQGSGENVDFGMEIQGPGAARFVETFRRDVELSRGRSVEAIYGSQIEDLRQTEGVVLQTRGVLDLLESRIPGGPRTGESWDKRVDRVLESASYQGLRVSDLVELPNATPGQAPTAEEERAWLLAGRGEAVLTEKGRHLLADGVEATVNRMNSTANQETLQAIRPPSAQKVGNETMAVGDTAVERQAMVLHAIDSAEKYIKVSAFVLNEDLARLLVEKKEAMEAQGKPFEVQVVMDPGVYPYGGSPNEAAHRLLEDRGVEVRWAALDRSTPDHDRKVHAKLLLTDQMMVAGSTNFSHKGLRDNWELSDVTFFQDEASRADQQRVEADFQHLWGRESLAIDTRGLAESKHGVGQDPESVYLRDEERTRSLRGFLRGIGNLEKEIGRQVQDLRASDPVLAYTVDQRVREGQSEGYATLNAVGEDRLARIRYESSAWQTLQQMLTT